MLKPAKTLLACKVWPRFKISHLRMWRNHRRLWFWLENIRKKILFPEPTLFLAFMGGRLYLPPPAATPCTAERLRQKIHVIQCIFYFYWYRYVHIHKINLRNISAMLLLEKISRRTNIYSFIYIFINTSMDFKVIYCNMWLLR